MKATRSIVVLLLSLRAAPLFAQTPAAITTDPPPDAAHPAAAASPDILSHGGKMYAQLYTAAGAGLHPTLLMLHGFPGNEKNLEVAQAVRRAGWNVLVPFYRGAWGSPVLPPPDKGVTENAARLAGTSSAQLWREAHAHARE